MPTSPIDRLLDWTVVGGYSRFGYAVRSRSWAGGAAGGRLRRPVGAGHRGRVGHRRRRLRAPRARRRNRAHAGPQSRARRGRAGADLRAHRLRSARCSSSATSPASLRCASSRPAFRASIRELQALINNAGMMPPERTQTAEGFELSFATNVLGPFLLTNLLIPALRRGAPAAIVNVSSGGMYSQRLRCRRPAARASRLRPARVLCPHQALRGDPDPALGRAPARNRRQRPLDAPGLGRHARACGPRCRDFAS